MTIAPGSNLTADRTLTVTTGDAARTLTLSGNATLNQDVSSTGTPTFSTVTSGAGSVTVPALTTTGDTNTGVYYPAADTVAVTTGGAERLRVDSSGNVGIATVSPGQKLDVTGNINGSGFLRSTSGGQTTQIQHDGTNGSVSSSTQLLIYSNGANATVFHTNSTERWRINSAGHLMAGADNSYDIGASGATRPRNVYIAGTTALGGDVTVGGGTTASLLKFLEPSGSGTNYTAFKAQAQAGDVTYTLPAADGTSGQLLSTNGSGTLSWATAGGASVLSKSANYTVQTSDGSNVVVLCTNTITITLYAASGNSGKIVNIKNNGTGTITIDANASELIDGALTQVIPTQYVSLSLVCDGTGWAII